MLTQTQEFEYELVEVGSEDEASRKLWTARQSLALILVTSATFWGGLALLLRTL